MTNEEKNAAFWALPPAQQRIEVAKDVLLQLEAERYRATCGVYVLITKAAEQHVAKHSDTDLQELLPSLGPCDVCARGAVFLSVVNKGDGCTAAASFVARDGYMEVNSDTRDDVSVRVFPIRMLRNMERYFELTRYYWPEHIRYTSPTERLMTIMQAVIDHEGDYKLEYNADMANIEER